MRYLSGKFEFHQGSRRLYFEGRHLTVNQRGIAILLCLIERNGKVVTKRELLQAIWPGEQTNDSRLFKQISLLRQAINGASDDESVIITVPGLGYRTEGWEAITSAAAFAESDNVDEVIPPVERWPLPSSSVGSPRSNRTSPSPVTDSWPRQKWRVRKLGSPLLILSFTLLFLSIVCQVEVNSNFGPTGVISARTHSGFKRGLRFSHDGSNIAYYQSLESDGAGNLQILNLASNTAVSIPGSTSADEGVAWAPGDRTVAFLGSRVPSTSQRQLVIHSLDSHHTRVVATVEGYGLDWSPVGQDLAVSMPFWVDGDSGSRSALIHLLGSDGSNPRRLTRTMRQRRVIDSHPRFSPDGSRIAFFRQYPDDNYGELSVIETASGEQYALRREHGAITQLEWSPDGGSIIFITNRNDAPRLLMISANNRIPNASPHPVTGIGDAVRSFSISGKGNLAYVTLPDAITQIDLVPLAKGPRLGSWMLSLQSLFSSSPVTDQVPCAIMSGKSAFSPAFSPNGRRVAFISSLTGGDEIWVTSSHCTNQQQLTFFNQSAHNGRARLSGLNWSPDGSKIVFTQRLDNQSDLFSLDVASGQVYQLTSTLGDEVNPTWSVEAGVLFYGFKQLTRESKTLQLRRLNLNSNETQILVEGFDNFFGENSEHAVLYFARDLQLWEKDLKTGDERLCQTLDRVAESDNLEIGRHAIYLLKKDGQPRPKLLRYSLSNVTRPSIADVVQSLDLSPSTLNAETAVSPDGQVFAYASIPLTACEIHFLNFRP